MSKVLDKTTWWAAADSTGRIFAHPSRPKRNETSRWWVNDKEFYKFLGLNEEASSHPVMSLTWEDEPVEIEVEFRVKGGDDGQE